jgi:hypothetical protein
LSYSSYAAQKLQKIFEKHLSAAFSIDAGFVGSGTFFKRENN